MIEYKTELKRITPEMLTGFFQGWVNRPSPAAHLRMLQNSSHVVLAIEPQGGRVVGIINAITDGQTFAYVPLLEVLPEYQGKGVGSELLRRMLAMLSDYYAVDLVCDPEMKSFYGKLGMKPMLAMSVRNPGNLTSILGRNPVSEL